ncbi:MAG: PD-(D/E)XK nuclease-like domain-containing protein [Hominimerdicola sp.]
MINNSNYFSSENSLKFMSASQFKSFQNCEAMALAEVKGEFKRESEKALLIGSYVDAWFEGTLDKFKGTHPEIFTQKGTLRAEYVQADEIIKRVTADELFMKYMSGEKQAVVTGNIAGIEFKGKLDSYHAGKCIVDLKVIKDFEPIWKNGRKMSFIEAWGYDIQGAIYQELVYQSTGVKLPFFICAVTKEKVPNLAIISIPQERLDECLESVKFHAPHYQQIKTGEAEPVKCGKCDYCKSVKVIDSPIDYRDLNPELFREQPVSVSSIVQLPENISDDVIPETKGKKKHKKKHKNKKGKVKVIIVK